MLLPALRRGRGWVAAWGLLLLLTGCTGGPGPLVLGPTPTPASPPLPPVGGRIAFLSDRHNGKRELWVINPDGSRETVLTPDRVMVGPAAWSPSGARLAFVADEGGKAQIGVLLVNADNTAGTTELLTAGSPASDNTLPAWSPDGRQIAFQSDRTGSFQIFTMPSVGGAAGLFAGQPPYASSPAWSPDGKTLAFAAGADSTHTELYTVPAAGGAPLQLTNNGRAASRPLWTPDGKALLFLLQTSGGTHNVAEVRPDGTGQREFTTGPQEDLFPTLSPDGQWIAFYSNRTRNNEVFVMTGEGTGLTDVSNTPSGDVDPAWAPDSSRLVFASRGGEGYRLYIVGRDGRQLAPLTTGSGAYDDTFPVWSVAP